MCIINFLLPRLGFLQQQEESREVFRVPFERASIDSLEFLDSSSELFSERKRLMPRNFSATAKALKSNRKLSNDPIAIEMERYTGRFINQSDLEMRKFYNLAPPVHIGNFQVKFIYFIV